MDAREARQPSETVLYRLVEKHLEGFLASRPPWFIIDTFRGFLDCGNAEKGGVRLRCRECGHEEFVAFSCKLRGMCTSCTARTATEVSERLVREVFPDAAYRQWVVNYPLDVSQKLSFQPKLISAMERMVMGVIRKWNATRSGCWTGGMLFRHRFGSNLNLLIHDHVVAFDGGFIEQNGALVFVKGAEVEQEELDELARALFEKMEKLLKRHNVMLSTGSGASTVDTPLSGLVARYRGLHVFASAPVSDREELRKLFAYLLRGGMDVRRLRELPDGRYAYRLNKKDRNGERELVLTGVEVLQRLASLIPAKRIPQRRYFGVLAAGSSLRKRVVPKGWAKRGSPYDEVNFNPRAHWADLMWRVFGIDVMKCVKCGGRMDVVRQVAAGAQVVVEHAGEQPIRGPPLMQGAA